MTNTDPLLQYLGKDMNTSIEADDQLSISKSRDDYEAIFVIQKRQKCIDLIKEYRYATLRNKNVKTHYLSIEIQSLFDTIRSMYKADKNKDYTSLAKQVYGTDINEIIQAFYTIDEYLYSKNVTKIDVRRSFAGMGAIEKNKFTKK